MARFGSFITFGYTTGDTYSAATSFTLQNYEMPNYPIETFNDTDRQIHKTKTGRKYIYQNYNLQGYRFNFSNLAAAPRGSLKTMYDARPIFTVTTNGSLWGTFRFAEEGWKDEEVAFNLFDLSISFEEDA